jgi:glycosyltransferase involved in cell wall biosynthesis
LGLPDDAPVVLYSGTFEAYQGLECLIAAAPRILERVPSARFVFVGADKTGRIAVEAAAADLVHDGILTVVDRQPRWMIPSYLALADVLVSPRAFGGNLPLKVFDYLAAGRPIVATDIETHRTVLNGDRAVLVTTSPEGLAEGIVSVLCDGAKAAALAGAAREYAVEHLGWGRFLRSVAEIYQEVHRHVPA